VAVLIAVFGIVLGRVVRRVVDRLLFRLGFNDWFRNFNIGRSLLRSGYTPIKFFGSVAAWLLYLIFILTATAYLAVSFGRVDVSKWVTSIITV
jgi:hypothetical protein